MKLKKKSVALLLGIIGLASLSSCKMSISINTSSQESGSSTVETTPVSTTETTIDTSISNTEVTPTTETTPSTTTSEVKPSTTTEVTPITTKETTETTTTEVKSTYTVTFETNGGSDVEAQTVEAGKTISSVTTTRSGYVFKGWCTDYELTVEFNMSSAINNDMKIYAKWAKIVTVTFDSNGGSSIDSQTLEYGETINYETPTRTNYTFLGWFSDAALTTAFTETTTVTKNITLYAKWQIIDEASIITDVQAYNEGAFVEFKTTSSTTAANSTVSYSKDGVNFTSIDSELIRYNSSTNTVRADILGLAAGSYVVRVYNGESTETSSTINVSADDRSGYAHFGYSSGVGAYNNDGTLKDNAVVIYVTNATKNSVTATLGGSTYTGLVNILKNLSKSSYPVVIRLLDEIQTTQFNEITYTSEANTNALVEEQAASLGGNKASYSASDIIKNKWNSYSNDIANGITELTGLSSKVSYSDGEFDTAWNMCSISGAKNVTLEGVGTSAGIFQWGMTWSKCDSIEVKNLTFSDYTEDACSFEAGSVTANGNYWIHNNTFNRGKNNWDFSYEQDKHYGDGATDFKKCHNITSSYNVFNNCKKTGLVGGGNSQLTMSVTFHHNFYNTVGSRLPLGRQANMHIYNNYYYNCSTCQDIRANAFVLSEANYFEGCANPQKVTVDDTYTGTVIKSYNDYLTNCGSSAATVVTDRTATLKGNCKPDGSTDYTNFDTNSSQFYYDSTNKKSNVTILNTNTDVKTFVPKVAGAGTLASFGLGTYNTIDPNVDTFTVTFNTNGGSSVSAQTVASGSTISSVSTKKSGYTFAGWYTDSGLTNLFDTSTKITADITLYAKWEESSSGSSSTTSTVLTLNSFTTETLSANTTVGDLTVTIKSGKTIQIKECDSTTIADTAITKYVYFGGGGSYSAASIQFSTTATANITVYYAGGEGRYAALFNSSGNVGTATTATTAGGVANVVSYTFENIEAGSYAIASSNSSLEFYAIVITY